MYLWGRRLFVVCFFKQKTAYEMRISDWSSDVCSSDLALVMSGWPVPTPAQNSFMPPPVPVLSTTGALKLLVFANCSATAVEKGKTVEEPTMRIWSREIGRAPCRERVCQYV